MTTEKNLLIDQLERWLHPKGKVQQEAWNRLSRVGLPHKASEAYKHTPITRILEKKIEFTPTNTRIVNPVFYKSKGNHLVFINGRLNLDKSILTDGLAIKPTGVTEGYQDPFSLLNTALSPEEVQITINKKVHPIYLYHFSDVPLNSPRIKITVKEGEEVTIYERIDATSHSFTNLYVTFDLAKNTSANLTKIQNYAPTVYTHETMIANLAKNSRFYSNTFSFSGDLIRNNLIINLLDEASEGHIHGLYLLNGSSHVDNHTSVDHIKPNAYSNELYKGILDEKSKGVFNGRIYVRQDAQKTNAFQSNHNILLSDGATIHTKPQLEIWADDVKCSHGCTSGQLDQEAIFYLRTRGINEKKAKAMILHAFASETLVHVKDQHIKDELESLILQKLV